MASSASGLGRVALGACALAAGCHTLLDIDEIEFGDPGTPSAASGAAAAGPGSGGGPAAGSGGACAETCGGACPLCEDGAACDDAAECESGACADGVCCDSACDGACESCALNGSEGECTLVAAGTDPDGECSDGESCDGAGACKLDDGQSCGDAGECVSGACADGVCCDSDCDAACDACDVAGSEGTCTLLAQGETGSPSCAPYLCDGGALDCPQSCSDDGACASGFRCSAGVCRAVSCKAVLDALPGSASGTHTLDPDGDGGTAPFDVYCDMTTDLGGWTLVARFSNADFDNWMNDSGAWWYDKVTEQGTPTSRSENADMISAAFWLVGGAELKIARSDNADDAFLLLTNAGCLGGQSFRAKITSYGDFRNGAVWGDNSVQGSCAASLGNNYAATGGFAQADCTGTIGAASALSFWSEFGTGDGAVMMIGGGGSACDRADHGIGVTEASPGSFQAGNLPELDFGDDAADPVQNGYALNVLVR